MFLGPLGPGDGDLFCHKTGGRCVRGTDRAYLQTGPREYFFRFW